MKKIETLVDDIYEVLKGDRPDSWSPDVAERFTKAMSNTMDHRLNPPDYNKRGDGKQNLRMSSIGQACARKLYYNINGHKTEELDGPTYMKFMYGDVVEEVLLGLADASGHKVEGQQDEMNLFGIKGHRDAVIDGMLVDVKSASSFGFKKFAKNGVKEDDPFGYITQLSCYLKARQDDPLVTNKKEAAFLVMDKVTGKLCLDVYNLESEMEELESKVTYRKKMVKKDKPPSRSFTDKPEGASGNRTLGLQCSYCGYKQECWPGVRTFLYAGRGGDTRPVFLTVVAKTPKVMEVT